MIVQEMTREENTALVSAQRLGRLACVRDNRPYIVPFYYALSDNHLYSFSMQGQKIDWMRENAEVCSGRRSGRQSRVAKRYRFRSF